jgi:hypothetical protein
MEVQAALTLASHEKSEVVIFLEGMIRQGIITRAHATYLLDMYPIETRDDLSLITNMELRDTPEGLWQKGHSPGPLSVKQTNLFLRSVIGYLHYDKASKVEVCETNDDMGPQVLLLPTGKAVRFSPEMQKHSEDEARIEQEVERRGALRDASMQARWLEQNQGQVGYHAQHGEAMSKFPTRPEYHAAMVEEAQRDTNSSTFSYDLRDNEGVTKFSYDMRDRHAAMVEEAQRDTNSSTFSYDLRDNEGVVHQATAPRPSWSFKDFPGYSDRSRNAEDARQRETQERSRQVEHAEFMQAARTEEKQREADRASLMETVVAGVVAGIEAQSQRTNTGSSRSRSAANAAVQARLTGSITSLLGDIPTKGEGIDTDSLKWDTYLTAWIMAAGQLCALPDDPHGGSRLQVVFRLYCL